MDIRQLVALIAVAEEGSVTGAARRLGLVQPAVSRQIRSLEAELGVQLFERTSAGMQVTDSGEVMLDRARRAVAELERARAELQPSTDDVRGVVSVGLLDSMTDVLAGRLVSAVHDAYPKVRLQILTAYSGHLREWLSSGDLDLALLYDLRAEAPFRTDPAGGEQLWAIAPAGTALESERPVPLKQLADIPLVLPQAGHGLRLLIDQAFAAVGRRPRVAVETNSMRVQKLLVRDGHGWSILPAIGAVTDVASGLLSGAPVSEPPIQRTIVIVSRDHHRRRPAVRAVADQLALCLEHIKDAGEWPGHHDIHG